MNNKTTLIEEDVNFVDNTKKQNKYFKIILSLIVIIVAFFYFISYSKIIQSDNPFKRL